MSNLSTPLPYSQESKAMYNKRYFLFSKFDKGIIIDEDSWSSITPEEIAKHIAKRV
jgi:trimethylguanosine synthase